MSVTFFATADGGPEVNVHNANAATLLSLLGYLKHEPSGELVLLDADDSCGEDDAEGFLGRVLIAKAFLSSATDDEHGTPWVIDGNFMIGSRSPGRLAERLAELQEMAEWAQEYGHTVAWG